MNNMRSRAEQSSHPRFTPDIPHEKNQTELEGLSVELEKVFEFIKNGEKIDRQLMDGESVENVLGIHDEELASQISKHRYSDGSPLRPIIAHQLGTLPMTPAQYEIAFTKILDKYVGDRNRKYYLEEETEDDSGIHRGDNFLISTLLRRLRQDADLQKDIAPEFAQKTFSSLVRILEQGFEKEQEQWQTDFESYKKERLGLLRAIQTDSQARQKWEDELRKLYDYDKDSNFMTAEDYIAAEEQNLIDEADELSGSEQEEWDPIPDWLHEEDAGGGLSGEHIQMINLALRDLGPHGNRETIDTIIDLMERYGADVTGPAAEAFSAIDPTYAGKKILDRLRAAESKNRLLDNDKQIRVQEAARRKDFARVLRRLEFGKIGISEEGVSYLEKLYDLGEYNDPDNFVRRLTTDGHIGIFDKEKILQKFFLLGDLASPEKRLTADLHDVTLTLLFSQEPKDDEERRLQEKIMEQFRQKYLDFYNDHFFKNTGVHFNNLSLREQAWFIRFVLTTDAPRQERAYSAILKFGEPAVRSFLSVEYHQAAGDEILSLAEAETLDRSSKEHIFAEFSRVVDFADDLTDALTPHLQTADQSFNREVFYSRLIERAQEFIHYCFLKVKDGAGSYRDIAQAIRAEQRALDPETTLKAVVARAVIEMTNSVGDTAARSAIDQAHTLTSDGFLREKLALVRTLITPPVENEDVVHDLGDFYSQKIKFESYKLNARMQAAELEFIAARIAKSDRVLDLGCGTGRHLKPLRDSGLQIDGLDYSERHTQMVKNENPTATVVQGDWKQTPFADSSYNVIYSLGRNILHENTITGQHRLFAEVNRLLPLGGAFIFDIPDKQRGSYKELAEKYQSVMKDHGIINYRYGTVYDSPDGKHFMTRFVYSLADIRELAEANGFAVEEIVRKELKNGHGDYNIYITLRKIGAAAFERLLSPTAQAA